MSVAQLTYETPSRLPLPPRRPPNQGRRHLATLASEEFKAQVVGLLPDLERRARTLTRHGDEAWDLVQDTCRRGLEGHAQFRAGSDLRAWLFCILRNLRLDRQRRAWREVMSGSAGEQSPAPEPQRRPLWTQVSDEDMTLAVASLPAHYRTPYIMHAQHGRSYSEVAKALNVGTNTVGTRLLRARVRLRSFLLARLAAREIA